MTKILGERTPVIKKSAFDVCAGECATCVNRGVKNLSALTVCVKRKVVTKFVPPDTASIKLLLERQGVGKELNELSDEELKQLEAKLKNELLAIREEQEDKLNL